MKYDPRVRFYPAFDDGDLFIDLEEEFTDSERGQKFVRARNAKEVQRLGGREPDTRWFLIKVVQKLTIEWVDKASHQPPKPRKKVVRKTAQK